MNTIGTSTIGTTWRGKYATSTLQKGLRRALVAEAVCQVDNSDSKYIHNPYITQPTATVQTIAGTYAVSSFTITDDSLTVSDEFIYSVHIYDFEDTMSQFNLFADFTDELTYAVKAALDKWVINNLCEDGTGSYSTPAGGFTTPSNWPIILSNLLSKVAGYSEVYKGLFLIVEAGDLVGVIQSQMASGFNFADAALRNGLVSTQAGIDIYVVPDSSFVDATTTSVSGSKTWTNSGHRVFGVKGMATYAAPRGIKYEEKFVTSTTGKEIAVYGYCGFKLWTTKAGLIVDITIT